jgi:putative tryptophan/tyrosine transport system substrate-binding protein
MRRREFITLLGGAAAAWPLAARAQPGERVRRIGVLINVIADIHDQRSRLAAFRQALQQLGWADGRNIRIDYRLAEGDPERLRSHAAELIALTPDAMLAVGSPSLGELQRATRTIPIVFVTVTDPVAGGFVDSLARPLGNITGFAQFEYSLSGKWLELLKEIAPRVTRAAVIRNPANASGIGQFAAIQAAAPSFGIELRPVDVRDPREIERAVTAFARASSDGLIVTSAGASGQRDLIIALAARHRLPAVYPFRFYVAAGGLVSYGPDFLEQYRQAAGYIDRILKGEKPADLPVQQATKFELVINAETARMLGLTVPPTLLATADEVIE